MKGTSMQPSLWPDERDQWQVTPQLSGGQKPRPRQGAKPPLETLSLSLWEQEREVKPRTLAELQESVSNFQYQPRPVPVRSFQLRTARKDIYASGYEIVSTDPQSNLWSARKSQAEAIVSLSGGLGSAVAAERAIQKHGRENVLLWKCESSSTESSFKPNFLSCASFFASD